MDAPAEKEVRKLAMSKDLLRLLLLPALWLGMIIPAGRAAIVQLPHVRYFGLAQNPFREQVGRAHSGRIVFHVSSFAARLFQNHQPRRHVPWVQSELPKCVQPAAGYVA